MACTAIDNMQEDNLEYRLAVFEKRRKRYITVTFKSTESQDCNLYLIDNVLKLIDDVDQFNEDHQE